MSFQVFTEPLPANYFQGTLDRVATMGDPLAFFMMESQIKEMYRRRIPSLSATNILTGGFRRWQLARNTYRSIEEMCEMHHLRLIQAVMDGMVETTAYQARYLQRELQWTEEVRRARQVGSDLASYQAQLRREAEAAQKRRDDRLHHQALELLDLNLRHQEAMARLNLEARNPDVNHLIDTSNKLREQLQMIDQMDLPERTKHQWATTVINLGNQAMR